MDQYSILLSIECGPKKMVTNGKLLTSMHVSHENNKVLFTLKAQDICLNTEQNVCHFEIHLDDTPNTVHVYTGKGCVYMRSSCNFIFIDDIATDIDNHLNFCVCNFTNIVRCDFSY